MSRPKVILLTNRFPYGIVETFIEAEMRAVPNGIDLEIFPTQRHNKNDTARSIPDGIIVNNGITDAKSFDKICSAIKAIFDSCLWKELRERRKSKYEKRSLKLLFGFFARAHLIARMVEKSYGKLLLEKQAVLYSYWFLEQAYAAARLSKKYSCKSYTRAHGTDLWDGNCVYGKVPGRQKALGFLDGVFVCSKRGAEYLKEKFPEYRDKISYSYLGTEDYSENKEKEDEVFTVLSCSRTTPVKRVLRIADALSMIDEIPIRWIHIGDGPEQEKVKEHVKKLPSNITAEFLGNVSHDEVMKYFCSHHVDLFINVSSTEGLPVSIMEAVSFGIPIVATNVGGTGEIVNDNTGSLIDKDFEDGELCSVIKSYAGMKPEEYSQKRRDVRKYWQEHFSAESNYMKFYMDITGTLPENANK